MARHQSGELVVTRHEQRPVWDHEAHLPLAGYGGYCRFEVILACSWDDENATAECLPRLSRGAFEFLAFRIRIRQNGNRSPSW